MVSRTVVSFVIWVCAGISEPVVTCVKSAMETLEEYVRSIQS